MINKKNKRCLTGICVFYNANPILPQPPPPFPRPEIKKIKIINKKILTYKSSILLPNLAQYQSFKSELFLNLHVSPLTKLYL